MLAGVVQQGKLGDRLIVPPECFEGLAAHKARPSPTRFAGHQRARLFERGIDLVFAELALGGAQGLSIREREHRRGPIVEGECCFIRGDGCLQLAGALARDLGQGQERAKQCSRFVELAHAALEVGQGQGDRRLVAFVVRHGGEAATEQGRDFACALEALGRISKQLGQVRIGIEALGIELDGFAQIGFRFACLAELAQRKSKIGTRKRMAGSRRM